MIMAYVMYPHDGDMFFFEDRKSSIFCPRCGTLLDKSFLPRGVRPRKRWDLSSTYDRRVIVTERFKAWCEAQKFAAIVFRQTCAQPAYYTFEPSVVLNLDPRFARFEDKCAACGNYESVITGGSMKLLGVADPIEDGIFRTDLEFGSRWEKSPDIIVGVRTKELIKKERFHLVHFEPIES